MRLSIIIPNYNKEKYIGKLLSQLKKQLLDGVEVIVVDDCSTDDSWNIIQEYKDVFKIIRLEKNSWVSRARNRGIEESSGEYITFIDSDDGIKPNFIKIILKHIETKRDGYFFDYDIYCDFKNVNVVKGEENTMVWSKVFKREVLDKNSIKFDEKYYTRYVLGEDTDFCCRFLAATTDIERVDIPIIDYSFGVDNSISNSKQVLKEESWSDIFAKENKEIYDKFFK